MPSRHRPARLRTRLGSAGAAAAVLTTVALAPLTGSGTASAVTPTPPHTGSSADATGQGWYQNQSSLDPSTVAAPGGFGEKWATPLAGQVYGSAVEVNGLLVVGTERDMVYGLNPSTGAIVWSTSVGTPVPSSTISGCSDLVPTFGITATPVVDPDGHTVYVEAATEDANGGPYHQNLVAINTAASGAIAWTAPDIVPVAEGDLEFDRAGLLWIDGSVLATFASHCDHGPYEGRVARIDTTSHAVTQWAAAPSGGQAGSWMGGAPITSDQSGRAFLAIGNGDSSADYHAAPQAEDTLASPPVSFGESAVRLNLDSSNGISVGDWFTPSNAEYLDDNDQDLGSGAVTILPAGWGGAGRHLGISAGKGGQAYLIDLDNLGHRASNSAAGPSAALDSVSLGQPTQPFFGAVAVFDGGPDQRYVYLTNSSDGASGSQLIAVKVGVGATGQPSLSVMGKVQISATACRCGAPMVTSNGTDPGSALVWVPIRTATGSGVDEFRAYAAIPDSSGALEPVWQSGSIPTVGTGSPMGVRKFSRAIATASGLVVLGGGRTPASSGADPSNRDGVVVAFGITNAIAGGPLSGPSTDLGQIVAGTSSTGGGVTVTAKVATTLQSVSLSSSRFTSTYTGPTALVANQTVRIPLTFSPQVGDSGLLTSTLTLTTSTGTTTLPVQGTAISGSQLLQAQPTSFDFGQYNDGASTRVGITLSNNASTALTVSSIAISPSNGAFSVEEPGPLTIPGNGQVIIHADFSPTAPGISSRTLVVTWSGGGNPGAQTSVPLTGEGVLAGALSLSAGSLAFPDTVVGQTSALSLTLSNTGGGAITFDKAKPPTGAFTDPAPVQEGDVLYGGQSVTQTIYFTPTAAGPTSSTYTLTASDGSGVHVITVAGQGVTAPVVSSPPPAPIGGGGATAGVQALHVTLHGPTSKDWRRDAGARKHGTGVELLPKSTGLLTSAVAVPSAVLSMTVGVSGGVVVGLPTAVRSAHPPVEIGVVYDPSHRAICVARWVAGHWRCATRPVRLPVLTGAHRLQLSLSHGVLTVGIDGKIRIRTRVVVAASVSVVLASVPGAHTPSLVGMLAVAARSS